MRVDDGLLEALHEGKFQTPLWDGFLQRLRTGTGAALALLATELRSYPRALALDPVALVRFRRARDATWSSSGGVLHEVEACSSEEIAHKLEACTV